MTLPTHTNENSETSWKYFRSGKYVVEKFVIGTKKKLYNVILVKNKSEGCDFCEQIHVLT